MTYSLVIALFLLFLVLVIVIVVITLVIIIVAVVIPIVVIVVIIPIVIALVFACLTMLAYLDGILVVLGGYMVVRLGVWVFDSRCSHFSGVDYALLVIIVIVSTLAPSAYNDGQSLGISTCHRANDPLTGYWVIYTLACGG